MDAAAVNRAVAEFKAIGFTHLNEGWLDLEGTAAFGDLQAELADEWAEAADSMPTDGRGLPTPHAAYGARVPACNNVILSLHCTRCRRFNHAAFIDHPTTCNVPPLVESHTLMFMYIMARGGEPLLASIERPDLLSLARKALGGCSQLVLDTCSCNDSFSSRGDRAAINGTYARSRPDGSISLGDLL